MSSLDVAKVRARFPALSQEVGGRPVVFLDNPGGTQVPQMVIDAMVDYLVKANANHGGAFATSQRSDAIIEAARSAVADFLNAESASEVIFGPNMTSLTFQISRALARDLAPGDEIIVTRLDHDANIAPWLLAAEDAGASVCWVDFNPEDGTLDLSDLRRAITDRTRIVAVTAASNATGSITDVTAITRWAHAAGALMFVDAVHYVPHRPIDVQAIGCDFLACSAYKFFGPHIGILYGRQQLLESTTAYKVRPATNAPPGKWETGTQNHEGIAGTLAAINYLAELGATYGDDYRSRFPDFQGRRLDLKAAMAVLQAYEQTLTETLLREVGRVPGVTIHGITDTHRLDERVPTVSFTWGDRHPRDIAAALGEQGIFVWDGNYYALAVTERLGVEEKGGMVRVGAAHYNTPAEIERLGAALREMA